MFEHCCAKHFTFVFGLRLDLGLKYACVDLMSFLLLTDADFRLLTSSVNCDFLVYSLVVSVRHVCLLS